jgi:murein DD-endopeptidase MepM/ murein hydrolase activator NlpD
MAALKRMTPKQKFEAYIAATEGQFNPVVEFNRQADKLYHFDLTSNNTQLDEETLADTGSFTNWISEELEKHGSRYGIGGYNEHRTIYSRSSYFDGAEEPRRLHLGTDIWGPAGTPIYNFMDGTVQSYQFNDHFGDYGATIILKYELEGMIFHALYGHLSLNSLVGLEVGQTIASGKEFATFGIPKENGYWPPHLHFQLILDMQGKVGDYPGVCQYSKADEYLQNCPDPYHILKDTFGTAAR